MYELLISGHYPTINEKDVARDVTIKIFLNNEIYTPSIKSNNLIVTDYLYQPVKGLVTWAYTDPGTPSGIANILTFTPNTYLDPNTTYIVNVPKYPDSVRAVDDSYIQQTYSFRFYTGIHTTTNGDPTYYEQLVMDLEAAIARGDWCEAARIQSILNGSSTYCGIPVSGYNSGVIIPDYLMLINSNPANTNTDLDIEYKLRFIKLTFNDEMIPTSGFDYASFINVTTKNVLE